MMVQKCLHFSYANSFELKVKEQKLRQGVKNRDVYEYLLNLTFYAYHELSSCLLFTFLLILWLAMSC